MARRDSVASKVAWFLRLILSFTPRQGEVFQGLRGGLPRRSSAPSSARSGCSHDFPGRPAGVSRRTSSVGRGPSVPRRRRRVQQARRSPGGQTSAVQRRPRERSAPRRATPSRRVRGLEQVLALVVVNQLQQRERRVGLQRRGVRMCRSEHPDHRFGPSRDKRSPLAFVVGAP